MNEIITSRKHPLVAQLLAVAENPSPEAFIVEGRHFVADLPPERVKVAVFSDDCPPELPDRLSAAGVRVCIASSPVMEKLSGTVSSQSALALVSKPVLPRPSRLLLLDGLQDPGNMGTVIRTAAAFGFGVVTGSGCASPYRQKTVRSSAGTVMSVFTTDTDDMVTYIQELHSSGYTVLSAELDGSARSSRELSPQPPLAVIIGNESRGVSSAVSAGADGKVYIPIARNSAESLNAAVAAGILMYLFG